MDTIETLSERNTHFAPHRFTGRLAMMPNLKTMIIGCADPRVDPADVLGLELGDAAVIRNIGGRITPATLQTMAMLRLVAAAVLGGPPGPGWNLIVLHHTDCGINHLTGYPDLLAEHFGVDKVELDSKRGTSHVHCQLHQQKHVQQQRLNRHGSSRQQTRGQDHGHGSQRCREGVGSHIALLAQ